MQKNTKTTILDLALYSQKYDLEDMKNFAVCYLYKRTAYLRENTINTVLNLRSSVEHSIYKFNSQ